MTRQFISLLGWEEPSSLSSFSSLVSSISSSSDPCWETENPSVLLNLRSYLEGRDSESCSFSKYNIALLDWIQNMLHTSQDVFTYQFVCFQHRLSIELGVMLCLFVQFNLYSDWKCYTHGHYFVVFWIQQKINYQFVVLRIQLFNHPCLWNSVPNI